MAGTSLGPSLTRRRFLIAAASGIGAAGFGGALGACGRPFSEPTEITAWLFPGGQGQGSPQQAVVDAFHKKQSDIRVKVTTFDYEDTYNRLIQALESGDGAPDVCAVESVWLGVILGKGGLIDLSQAPFDGARFEEDMVASTWSRSSAGGRLLAMPWTTDPGSMWYREDILEAAGIDADPRRLQERVDTWDDYFQLGLDLKRQRDVRLMTHPSNEVFSLAAAQRGLGWIDGDKLLIEEKCTRPAELLVRAHELGIDAATTFSTPPEESEQAMRQGRIASVAGSGGIQRRLTRVYPETVGKWRAARVPGGDVEWSASYLVMPDQGERQAAAWEFVRFACCTPEGQNVGFTATGSLPAYKPAWEDALYDRTVEFFGGQEVYRLWTEIAANAPPGVISPHDPSLLDDAVFSGLESAFNGEKGARQAMRDAEATLLRGIPGLTA